MPDGELELPVSHLSETMLTLCMFMVSFSMLLLLPVAPEVLGLVLLLACAPATCPVMETVCPMCGFSCAVSPVMLYCLPFAEIT